MHTPDSIVHVCPCAMDAQSAMISALMSLFVCALEKPRLFLASIAMRECLPPWLLSVVSWLHQSPRIISEYHTHIYIYICIIVFGRWPAPKSYTADSVGSKSGNVSRGLCETLLMDCKNFVRDFFMVFYS